MKRFFIFFAACFIILVIASAQNNRLSITVCLPEYDNIPVEAHNCLEDKLGQLLTDNNVACGMSDRFVISAKINIIQRDIMPSTPVRISEKMNVTIIIGDAIENEVYGRTTISVIGIGVTEDKAYIQAFQRLSSNNPKIQTLITDAQNRIVDYYNNHCESIILEAERMANMNERKEAIAKLLAVPELCMECYNAAQNKAFELYKVAINDEARLMVKKAEAEWAIRHNYVQAQKALDYLLQVNPHSDEVDKADLLSKEIEKTLREQEAASTQHRKDVEKREWEMRVQQYNDNVALRKQRINMWKEIGVAIGNGLPQAITKVVKTW